MEENSDTYDNVLEDFLSISPRGTIAIIISTKGLPIASNFPQDVDDTLISAMLAAIYKMGERSIIECSMDSFVRMLIETEEFNIIISKIDPDYFLCSVSKLGVS